MKTARNILVVAAGVLVLVGGLAMAAGPGGGQGQGRGFGQGRGRGMGPGMGMGMGMRAHEAGPMGEMRGDPLDAIGAQLNLTAEQRGQIRTIHEQAQKDAVAARDGVAAARDALHDAVISGKTEAEIRAAGTRLGEAIGNQAALHAKTMAAMKVVLTEEQRKKFEEMKKDNQPGMGPRGPRGGGPFCPWMGDGDQEWQPPMHQRAFGRGGPWMDDNEGDQQGQPPMHQQGFGRGGPGGPRMGEDQADQQGQPPVRRQAFGGGGPLPAEEMFKAADTDKDGKLTLEELQAFRGSRRMARQPAQE